MPPVSDNEGETVALKTLPDQIEETRENKLPGCFTKGMALKRCLSRYSFNEERLSKPTNIHKKQKI